MARIDSAACAQMVAKVASRCDLPAAAPPPAPAHEPTFDALATSIAFGSAVLMAITLVVVILGVFVAVRWGQNVVREAKEDARTAAKKEVERVAPGLVADYMAAMTTSADGPSAEQQAEELGGEPG